MRAQRVLSGERAQDPGRHQRRHGQWPERDPRAMRRRERPAWLRVTLSERPSNKTLQIGDIRYGDGRGYADPFRTGETEDYLINRGDTGADIAIRKWARVDRFDPAHPEASRIAWVIEYTTVATGLPAR